MADSLTLLRKAAEAQADTLTLEEYNGPIGRKAGIAANRKALALAFSSDSTTLGTAVWHRYTYRTAQLTGGACRCLGKKKTPPGAGILLTTKSRQGCGGDEMGTVRLIQYLPAPAGSPRLPACGTRSNTDAENTRNL